ncbi:MAG: threonine synthase [Verrucomicrobiota bacterium]
MYKSTRGKIKPVNFEQSVLMGLADDGGLLIPAEIPDVSGQLENWQQLSYTELALEVMKLYLDDDDIPVSDLKGLIDKSYSSFENEDITPLVKTDSLYLLELFHGPTLAFKDIALQFLGNLFEYLLEKSQSSLNIVGATSGDTGSAAIYGVRGKKNINIFIMHPEGRVSSIQKQQMTTVRDNNVHNIAIQGTFDDTQRLLKELFNDLEFKQQYNLAAVNSVNWARVLAQIVYYFYAYFRIREQTGSETVRFCVPTGNFGNIFAGYLACRMGLPGDKLILASNENDILAHFFQTGDYVKGNVHSTHSPSMDIQVASNFERYLYYRCGENPEEVNRLLEDFQRNGHLRIEGDDPLFTAGRATDEETLATIRDYYQTFNYLLDPHTAVAVKVAREHEPEDTAPVVCLATAHPAKFPEAIKEATGKDCARHPTIDKIMHLRSRCVSLPPGKEYIADFIADRIATPAGQ